MPASCAGAPLATDISYYQDTDGTRLTFAVVEALDAGAEKDIVSTGHGTEWSLVRRSLFS